MVRFGLRLNQRDQSRDRSSGRHQMPEGESIPDLKGCNANETRGERELRIRWAKRCLEGHGEIVKIGRFIGAAGYGDGCEQGTRRKKIRRGGRGLRCGGAQRRRGGRRSWRESRCPGAVDLGGARREHALYRGNAPDEERAGSVERFRAAPGREQRLPRSARFHGLDGARL